MSKRIVPLQRKAEVAERASAAGFVAAQQRLAEREARLAELEGYLAEYLRRDGGTSPLLLANHHAFVARLRAACEGQAALVAQARTGCDTERARWLLANRDTRVLDELSACYVARENLVQARREQNQADEAALRAHRLFERHE